MEVNLKQVEMVSVFFAKYLKDAGYIQKKNFKLYTRYGEAAVTFFK